MRRVDDTDLRILHLLQANPRSPVSHIARHVKLTDNAVRCRIRRLQQAGVIREFVMVVDPAYLGRPVLHLLLLKLSDLRVLEVLVPETPDVAGAYACDGEYDATLLVCAADGRVADIAQELRGRPGVVKVTPLTVRQALRGAPMPMAPVPLGLEKHPAP
ncbi:MAG: Lrp/AsnC family transcriptional regulator [Halobacteriales archaeon]|nr:Lrp/AsnC family transcriptional regulator [Halobacteriales archaeon]